MDPPSDTTSGDVNSGYAPDKSNEAFVKTGNPEYHEAWGVRKYDLTNLKDDLEHCTRPRNDLFTLSSVLFGVGTTFFVSCLLAITTKPLAPLWLREVFGFATVIFIVLGLALGILGNRNKVTAATDLTYVSRRVDGLISMFDDDKLPGDHT